MDNRPDSYHIERVLKGDADAFAPIVERYSGLLFALVVRIVGERETAEEVLQDVFVKAYRSLATFRGGSSFSTFLYRIAYNAAVSATRRRRYNFTPVDERMYDPDATDTGDKTRAEAAEERYKVLERALEQLEPVDRALVQMFYFDSRPVGECAQVIGISESNTKVRLHRIRKRLYDIIIQENE